MSGEIFRGLDELFDYKNQLMADLLTSETIVSLLTDGATSLSDAGSLMYTQVFPYELIPDVTEHAQTFICCEVDIENVINKTYLRPVLYVWVFTHKNLVRLTNGGGVRTDRISSEIVEILNGNRNYGLGELELYSAKRFAPITGYQGRLMKFIGSDYNRLSPTGKKAPARRKG